MAVVTLSGVVLRVAYHSTDNDWSVLHVRCAGDDTPVTVVGHTICQPGQVIEAEGEWRQDRRFGREFAASDIVASNPSTEEGLAAYLGSGVLSGIGSAIAELMVEAHGDRVFEVLEREPEKLLSIQGIGPSRLASVTEAWKAERCARHIMAFLRNQHIPAFLCRRIYQAYGDGAMEVLRTEPYRLCAEVRGVGFKTADVIGRTLGISVDSSARVRAGFAYAMDKLTEQGHCGCPRDKLVSGVATLLALDQQAVATVLDEVLRDPTPEHLFDAHEDTIYDASLARAEERLAGGLHAALSLTPRFAHRVTDALIQRSAEYCDMELAPKQQQAVQMATHHKVSVITGGPGCGKTSTLRVLLDVFRRLRLQVSLVAPTGKAAQRACQATGHDARTIHRLLGINDVTADTHSHVHTDVMVIDETSMVDVRLMDKVVDALSSKTSLILVGDVDQLPSVGPGRVLTDIIESEAVPVTRLDHVFRQAAGSAIVTNAHAINAGRMPISASPGGDFFVVSERRVPAMREAQRLSDSSMIPGAAAAAAADEVVSLVTERLSASYGFNPVEDIQVLAPMNKGTCGVLELNARLQTALNPSPPQWIDRGSVRFGVGDKILQVRNNYRLDIFNGDVGIIHSVNDADKTLEVLFDARHVSIPFEHLRDVRLAYAATIHKSQGCQVPCVVIPLVMQHWSMLQRNLLYTGVTRARKLAVLVCQTQALGIAVHTVHSSRRVTRLGRLLRVLESA